MFVVGKVIVFYWLVIFDKYIFYLEIGLDYFYNSSFKVFVVLNRFEFFEFLDIFLILKIIFLKLFNLFRLKFFFIGCYRNNCGLDFLVEIFLLLDYSYFFELYFILDFF